MDTNSQTLHNWLVGFDYKGLEGEPEVESKFIVPLFRHLNYGEEYRRDKYSLDISKKFIKRVGRKPEPDFVLFSEGERDLQNENTALILIEAKRPGDNLKEALKEAQDYAYYLKPFFIVVTNGYDLKVVHLKSLSRNEIILATNVDELKDSGNAKILFDPLNFSAVCTQKQALLDLPSYSESVQLWNAISEYPKLQEIIKRGEFAPEITRKDKQIKVVRRKISIDCHLPETGLDRGECRIEFSNPLRSGLVIRLTHEQIVANLLTGLHTNPRWNTRRFLQTRDSELFLMTLGSVSAHLTESGALDLCDCVDIIFNDYRQEIIELEDRLKSWDYERLEIEYGGGFGFHLLTVPIQLWFQMMEFSRIFDSSKGDSEWHIFS